MTEADLEREASRLYKKLGLNVGADSLNFFLVESVRLRDWKKLIKPPPGNHRISNGTVSKKMAEFTPNNGVSLGRTAVDEKNLVNGSSNGHSKPLPECFGKSVLCNVREAACIIG